MNVGRRLLVVQLAFIARQTADGSWSLIVFSYRGIAGFYSLNANQNSNEIILESGMATSGN